MSAEAVVLGLLCAVRAVPLAVVYALLRARNPRRLLAAYLAAGAIVSLGVGIAVVGWLDARAASAGSSTAREVVYVVVGVGALSYAGGFWSGRIGNGSADRPSRGLTNPDGAVAQRLRKPTIAGALATGALTNLPGLFYIAGLAAILETAPTLLNSVVQVVVFNLLRFAVPVTALALLALRPETTRTVIDAIHDWAVRHSRPVITGVFGVVGIYLSVKGLVGLLG
ncbi:GAP family protein [Amycolatopsis sp. NPDC051903]|uniref:GAP family protein n=1 Tax=Amycolatopsis sp. NPDC051903 TaxID=3363936 RepID=UPI0037A61334